MARRADLTRDERLRCRVLRDEGRTYPYIASRVGCSERQARRACDLIRITPQKKTGRRPKLAPEHLEEVISWIQASFTHRCMKIQTTVRIFVPENDNLSVNGGE
jgi:transposase